MPDNAQIDHHHLARRRPRCDRPLAGIICVMRRPFFSIPIIITSAILVLTVAAIPLGDLFGKHDVPATRLVYALRVSPEAPSEIAMETADALKKRIDPSDIHGVRVRAIGADRIEILVPTADVSEAKLAVR